MTCLFAASITGAWWERQITLTGAAFTPDKDGDNVFAIFDDNTTTLIGGTGKYKGITGTVSYTNVDLHDTVGGRAALITNHKATWEIK